MMQPRNSKNGKGFLKALSLQEGGARLVLMIKDALRESRKKKLASSTMSET